MSLSSHDDDAVIAVDPVLRACPVFAQLDARSLVRLSTATGRHSYDKGQIVFHQGYCMYVLSRGSVEISVQDPDGGVAVLARIAPPTAFGEMAVIRRLPQRVRRHLLSESIRQTGTTDTGPDGVLVVDLGINQSDLARQVGGSRHQVNRILAELGGAGAIERRGQRIVAIRPALLAFDE
jgi:CRP-like cAMP-binding protein